MVYAGRACRDNAKQTVFHLEQHAVTAVYAVSLQGDLDLCQYGGGHLPEANTGAPSWKLTERFDASPLERIGNKGDFSSGSWLYLNLLLAIRTCRG